MVWQRFCEKNFKQLKGIHFLIPPIVSHMHLLMVTLLITNGEYQIFEEKRKNIQHALPKFTSHGNYVTPNHTYGKYLEIPITLKVITLWAYLATKSTVTSMAEQWRLFHVSICSVWTLFSASSVQRSVPQEQVCCLQVPMAIICDWLS